MRNTTKLKTLLIKYTICLDRNEDEQFVLVLTDKQTNESELFVGKSYSTVLIKAYSYLLKIVKN